MSPGGPAPAAPPKAGKKDRHVVTWSSEEDDLLREQIALHGTGNWTAIASRFKDKTSRQCRRRWFNYLNVESKTGGWSPEEDMLLFQAQKILGNRWTEIAKVVSGRTDNAVKNRFTTLCKKRANHETSLNTNEPSISSSGHITSDCILACTGGSSPPSKQMRCKISDVKENIVNAEMLSYAQPWRKQDHVRRPFSALSMHINKINEVEATDGFLRGKPNTSEVVDFKCRGNFIRRDDPKVVNLLQQADLLSSLAIKINTEKTSQSFDDAWKLLQDYLNQTEDNCFTKSDTLRLSSLLDDLKDLLENRSSSIGVQQITREFSEQADLHEPCSLEFSADATSQIKSADDPDREKSPLDGNTVFSNVLADFSTTSISAEEHINSPETVRGVAGGSLVLERQFSSPIQTVPFGSLKDAIPSPQFTSSEKRFLKTLLGLSSPQPSQECSQRQCKRALLDQLKGSNVKGDIVDHKSGPLMSPASFSNIQNL